MCFFCVWVGVYTYTQTDRYTQWILYRHFAYMLNRIQVRRLTLQHEHSTSSPLNMKPVPSETIPAHTLR